MGRLVDCIAAGFGSSAVATLWKVPGHQWKINLSWGDVLVDSWNLWDGVLGQSCFALGIFSELSPCLSVLYRGLAPHSTLLLQCHFFFCRSFSPVLSQLCFNPLVIATNCFWLAVSMSIFVLSLPSLLLFILFLQVFLYPFSSLFPLRACRPCCCLIPFSEIPIPWSFVSYFCFSFMQS